MIGKPGYYTALSALEKISLDILWYKYVTSCQSIAEKNIPIGISKLLHFDIFKWFNLKSVDRLTLLRTRNIFC